MKLFGTPSSSTKTPLYCFFFSKPRRILLHLFFAAFSAIAPTFCLFTYGFDSLLYFAYCLVFWLVLFGFCRESLRCLRGQLALYTPHSPFRFSDIFLLPIAGVPIVSIAMVLTSVDYASAPQSYLALVIISVMAAIYFSAASRSNRIAQDLVERVYQLDELIYRLRSYQADGKELDVEKTLAVYHLKTLVGTHGGTFTPPDSSDEPQPTLRHNFSYRPGANFRRTIF